MYYRKKVFRKQFIVISQLPVKEWYIRIGNVTIAGALLDRLIHNGHRIN
ncbi:ATP-binding protein [Shewanella hanedai]